MLLTLSPDDAACSGPAQAAFTSRSGRWDELEMFYADSGSWDEFIRVLESNEGRAESVPQRIAMLAKIAELWMTQKGNAGPRGTRVREGPPTRSGESSGRRASDPDLHRSEQPTRGLVNAIEVKLQARRRRIGPSCAVAPRPAALYEGRAERQGTRPGGLPCSRSRIAPTEATSQDDIERLARQTGALGRGRGKRTERASAKQSGRGDLLGERQRATPARSAEYWWKRPDARRGGTGRVFGQPVPRRSRTTSSRSKPWRTSTGRRNTWRELLEVFAKRLELLERSGTEEADAFRDRAPLRGQARGTEKAIETYLVVLGDDSEDARALEALDALYSSDRKLGVVRRNPEAADRARRQRGQLVGSEVPAGHGPAPALSDGRRCTRELSEKSVPGTLTHWSDEALGQPRGANSTHEELRRVKTWLSTLELSTEARGGMGPAWWNASRSSPAGMPRSSPSRGTSCCAKDAAGG